MLPSKHAGGPEGAHDSGAERVEGGAGNAGESRECAGLIPLVAGLGEEVDYDRVRWNPGGPEQDLC